MHERSARKKKLDKRTFEKKPVIKKKGLVLTCQNPVQPELVPGAYSQINTLLWTINLFEDKINGLH